MVVWTSHRLTLVVQCSIYICSFLPGALSPTMHIGTWSLGPIHFLLESDITFLEGQEQESLNSFSKRSIPYSLWSTPQWESRTKHNQRPHVLQAECVCSPNNSALLTSRNIELLTSRCLIPRFSQSFSEESGNKTAESKTSFQTGPFPYKYTHATIFAPDTMTLSLRKAGKCCSLKYVYAVYVCTISLY